MTHDRLCQKLAQPDRCICSKLTRIRRAPEQQTVAPVVTPTADHSGKEAELLALYNALPEGERIRLALFCEQQRNMPAKRAAGGGR